LSVDFGHDDAMREGDPRDAAAIPSPLTVAKAILATVYALAVFCAIICGIWVALPALLAFHGIRAVFRAAAGHGMKTGTA
jgi:hypothetical protein